ncbi:MAG: LacI family DNA-binding transcriptional regulator [Chromatiales bacterium]|nr:LacI family DNA-binding transcriptional regulator [Chromatiales bacterium]
MRKATINDVAEYAGVSIKTVSRVVNNEPNVREATREKVTAAIAKLKYRPNLSARNLASLQSHLIGLIYDDPSLYEIAGSGYVVRMQQGSLRACRSANYELLIHPCDYRSKSVGSELKTLIEHVRPAGIILAAPLSNMPKIVRVIEAAGTPFVKLSPGTRNDKHFAIATNDREVSAEMTEYLAALGHKRIAFITGHPDHKAVRNRFLGYKDGLRTSGIEFSQELVAAGDNSYGSGEECGARLLALKNPPTAIFSANDDMAAGVIGTATRLKISVPGQLSVAGFDDTSLARHIYPTMTTIRQPLATMAEQAAMALINRSRKDSPMEGTDIIPSTLQIRESTGPAPADA